MKSIILTGRRKFEAAQHILAVGILSALMSSVCLAGTYEYVWDSSNPKDSFGDGKVTLTLDSATISGMSVNSATGDTVTFSGDPMSFSSGATVGIERGLLDFANGIDAAGDIAFACTMPLSWIAADAGLYKDEFTTVLENVALADIEITAAYLNGGATGGDANGNAMPYYVTRGESWMEVQLQQWLSGGSTKVVKLRLEQVGADIKAKILYAKFVRSQNALGEDFDNPSGRYTIENMDVRTTAQTPSPYYGCNKLFFVPGEGVVGTAVSGPFVCLGTVDVAKGMKFGLVNQAGATIAKLSLPTYATFAVSADGSGRVDKTPMAEHDYVSNDWTEFAPDLNIKDIDINSISGTLAGSSLSTTPVEAWVGYCRWFSDTVLFVQFQYKPSGSSLVKGALAKLWQSGDNVEICRSGAFYYTGDLGTRSFEESTGITQTTYASSPTSGGYCIASFSAAFSRQNASRVTLVNGGSAKGGTIEIAGSSESSHAELRVTSRSGLPTNGVVNVGRHGVLSLINTDTYPAVGVSGGTCAIHVGPGGKFRQGGDTQFSANLFFEKQQVVIDGGEAEFGCECTKAASSADPVDTSGSTYLNFLTLRNGARCYGKAVRLGNYDAKWTVEGTSPSVWDTDISLLARYNSNPATVTFDVADVTSSAAVDFTVTGDMKMFNPSNPNEYKMLHVNKIGAGTIKVNGVTDFAAFPLVISNGVWMAGSDDTMNSAQNIRLEGGAFAAADGVHAAVGTLAVGVSDSGVVAGEGSTVSFLDSSAVVWGGGHVDVTCPQGASVRFGNSSSALTSSQQRKLYLNGARAKLDASGFVILQRGFAMSFR